MATTQLTVTVTCEESESLADAARRTGRTTDDLIREAIGRVIRNVGSANRLSPEERRAKIQRARGMWKDHPNPPDVRALRESWRNRAIDP